MAITLNKITIEADPFAVTMLASRCDELLRQYGVADHLVEYGDMISSTPGGEAFIYYTVYVSADFIPRSAGKLIDDIRIRSRSVDGAVLALDAILRAQLWPAREPERKAE